MPFSDPESATHNALFYTWFPTDRLNIPPQILPDITAIAEQVRTAMAANSAVQKIVAAMTNPQVLPFYACLKNSTDPAVQKFATVSGGYGALTPEEGSAVLAFLFEGDCPAPAGPGMTEFAMQIREIYLSAIWDLPLAVPLAQIQTPQTFVDDTTIYSKRHYPTLPPSQFTYDSASKSITHKGGPIDYLVIGSGPGGAAVAHQLREAGKRVVLIEQGPFVVWGSMDTMSYSRLMFGGNAATTSDNSIVIRSGQAIGGGTTVNIDLAFSPLESTIQARIDEWRSSGLIDSQFYSPERLAVAYQWVRDAIGTRAVSQAELNRDNLVLWDGAAAFGVNPCLYHLNRFPMDYSPSPVTQKRDAARQLILPAMQNASNPLSVIPDASVNEVRCSPADANGDVRAIGVSFTTLAPWTEMGNTIVDPCGLNIPIGTTVTIDAENVILSAGTIGTTRILLNSGKNTPSLTNPSIGKGLILHPSIPLIGVFSECINLLQGLDSATFVDSFGVAPGFIFETMTGLPAYGALLVPGSGQQVYDVISQFNNSAGFGVMLVDEPVSTNCVQLSQQGDVELVYAFTPNDKKRLATGLAIAIRMMFLAGAKQVIIPSNENFLGLENFNPMQGVFLTDITQADLVQQNIQFLPNRTLITSAHLQGTNKIGPDPAKAVVSTNQRVWNAVNSHEIPNLYVCDSSIHPTSIGANPMQSIYTFAKILADRLIHGMDAPPPIAWETGRHYQAAPVIMTQ